MSSTSKLPNVPVDQFKRTKIIATVGPATNSYDMILKMMKAGVNGFRLNFSHGTNEEREQQIAWIRKAEAENSKPVAIIQDLQGPKIRLGDFDGIITVQRGQSMAFKFKADYERSGFIPTQYDLAKKVKRGERLFLSDGSISSVITSVASGIVHARADNDGILVRRKGMNLPDTDFGGDVITAKDRKDIAFGSTQSIDLVAQSFVQTAADIEKLRKILKGLGSKAKIIAKVETKSAVDHLEEIIKAADVVMVARGDLATETPAEAVPIVQRKIVGLGLHHNTPTIVATQMLQSMTDALEPTRAEVSDVASSVIIGADAVMLSDETAAGKYPLQSIAMMKKIVLYTQNNAPLTVKYPNYASQPSRQEAICDAIIGLAGSLHARAIVAETASGTTALNISSRRPSHAIVAVTPNESVANQLAIVYGVMSFVRPADTKAATKLTNWLRQHNVLNKGDIIVTAHGKHPGVVGSTDTIKVRMLE